VLSFIEIGGSAEKLQLRQPPYRVKKWPKNRFFCNKSSASGHFKAILVHPYRYYEALKLCERFGKKRASARAGSGFK
jgi:hypothetical protein